MKHRRQGTKIGLGLLAIGGLLSGPLSSNVLGAQKLIDFNGAEYGAPDANCINNPVPPLFNRAEYAGQTAAFIVDPPGCGEGAEPGSNGSDSFLTAALAVTGNSNALRFSWENPADDETWARILTQTAGGTSPLFRNPTVHVGVGSKISMKIAPFSFVGGVPNGGKLQFAWVFRETGQNLPLGADGGVNGNVEFVGIDSTAAGVSGVVPVGGVELTASAGFPVFSTIEWTITSATTVSVSVNGGSAVSKNVASLAGDGQLCQAGSPCETNLRGTLDSLVIIKPADDDVSKKWFVWVDDIVIDSGALLEPVQIQTPLSVFSTEVTINFIDASATEVRLYKNAVLEASATDPPEDFSDGSHTFTGITLDDGDVLTATQIIGGNESDPSAAVVITVDLCIDDFDETVNGGTSINPTTPAFATWYQTVSDGFATSAATTLDGSPALLVDDGGFKNGVYAIYEQAVPITGTFQLKADIHVTEDPAQPAAITQYQVGVVVNGVHRDLTPASSGNTHLGCHNQSLIAVDTSLPGNAFGSYVGLTAGDDSGLPTQTVFTGEFEAQAGDNLLIVLATNVDSAWQDIPLDGTGRLDTQDPCETPGVGFPPPPPTPVPNEQGTWNVALNAAGTGRFSTSLTWGAAAAVRVDNICLVAPQACTGVAPVTVQGPFVTGQTSVTVNNVDLTATDVTVYANGVTPIGTAPGNGTSTVIVGVTALVSGDVISATQTVGGQEGCISEIGPMVDDCNQIAPLNVGGPVNANVTSVTVTGVSAGATAVTVYANQIQIGQLTTLVGGGTETVPVTALVKGETIAATQTIVGLEGCLPAGGQVVGSGGNSGILLSLGIRQTSPQPAGAVGEDGGIVGPEIEWLVDPASTSTGSPPPGKLIEPAYTWQTVTFDPATDRILAFTGDGSFGADTKGVLEQLAITADPNSLDVGPYTLYVDNITSGGVNFGDVEGITAGEQAIFRQPSFSGSTSGNISAPPNLAVVDGAVGDASNQSVRIEWRFIDEEATRWIRVTTNGTPNIPNPILDLSQPITLRVLLLPNVVCNDPFADVDGNGFVDGVDFAALQRCLTAAGEPLLGPECECLDRDNLLAQGIPDGSVTVNDFPVFKACADASGPAVPADPACDD